MEKTQSNPLVQYGIMSAVVGVFIYILLYLGGVKVFMSPVAYIGYAVPILFAVLACLKQKKNQGGFLEFSSALKISFGVFVLTAFATTVVSYLLMNYIDLEFSQAMQQASMEMSEKMMKRFGASQDVIDKALADSANKNPFSLGKMALGFAISCILWFLISLLIAVIVKKKNPADEMPQTM
ncbi:MAG: DUF4199 domain-containing protein [Chitinophagaceae bacterium]|jgi:hypothetical protein|nr:DUF4199 domain-containing protein [Chitinophagaceae bacterium]